MGTPLAGILLILVLIAVGIILAPTIASLTKSVWRYTRNQINAAQSILDESDSEKE